MKTIRKFHSYESVDRDLHYYVPREELIRQGYDHLLGDMQKGGHYITVWAPRQTGKSWIMREIVGRIRKRGDFKAAILTMQSAKNAKSEQGIFNIFIDQLRSGLEKDLPDLGSWDEMKNLFTHEYFDKPVILILDEFDAMGEPHINSFANEFRSMHGYRKNEPDRLTHEKTCLLHGLALVGVRSVLGIEDHSGSPFNVQRSLHIPNLTFAEVGEMFRWHERESGQKVEDRVVERLYCVTRGQPGLIGWFGELLTRDCRPGREEQPPMDWEAWEMAWNSARHLEPNNTLTNLIAKARDPKYQGWLLRLFAESGMPFTFHNPTHNYLYMHGIIIPETVRQPSGRIVNLCRFSSPFVQDCIYDALGEEFVSDSPILALEIGDALDDVLDPGKKSPDLPALLRRYKNYLARLREAGRNPWKEQPRRRTDLHLTEAVGHFHLYAWLQDAVGDLCIVSPEFPTGNGKVDIHIRCEEGIIELKSFRNVAVLRKDRGRAAGYAKSLGLDNITMAVFVPVLDEAVLEDLSGTETRDGIEVTVVAIGWV